MKRAVTVEFTVTAAPQTTLLPQAELLKGATGYVLGIQVGNTNYIVDISTIVASLSEVTKKDNEVKEVLVEAPFDAPMLVEDSKVG